MYILKYRCSLRVLYPVMFLNIPSRQTFDSPDKQADFSGTFRSKAEWVPNEMDSGCAIGLNLAMQWYGDVFHAFYSELEGGFTLSESLSSALDCSQPYPCKILVGALLHDESISSSLTSRIESIPNSYLPSTPLFPPRIETPTLFTLSFNIEIWFSDISPRFVRTKLSKGIWRYQSWITTSKKEREERT